MWRRVRRRGVAACAALIVGAGLATVAVTPASAQATACSVAYVNQSEWAGGFVAQVTITNAGSDAISGWKLGFTFPGDQKITNAWNGEKSQSGEDVTITNESYNATIAPGASTAIGFQGTFSASDAAPTAFTINGTACNGGGGTKTPTVSLTSPASGTSFTAPATITLSASASESGGSIAKVAFYNGSTLLGTATTAPYTYTWTNVPAGSYSLTAQATDANGTTATSQASTITVNPATTPGIVAAPTTLTITQGSSATYSVSLSAAPSSNVTVTSVRYSGGTGITISSGSSLTFTPSNWNTPQNVTLTADSSSTGTTVFAVASPGYTAASVTATEVSAGCGSSCGGGHVANPYVGATTYLNPDYVKEVNSQAQSDGSSAEAAVGKYQTAIWMDHIGAIAGDSSHLGLQAQLDDALTQQQGSTPEVFEVVIYDLPGRDCAALASNGEIPATAAGLTQYETQYIDPIASILGNAKYSSLRIVAVIEPDSLPNAVTNQSKTACATATPYYEQGIEYALNKLHPISNVYNYLDIAHSGWLGWPNNMNAAPGVYKQVVTATTAGYSSIDGFISNTANYTPVQEPFLPNPTLNVGGQPLDSATFYQWNPTFDELTYDTQMYNQLVSAGFPSSDKFLIDTSRNGWGGPNRPTSLNSSPTNVNDYVNANKIDERPFRGDWCNQNNAGIGARPQAQPFGASSPIEAFVWIKPPGESDGDYPSGSHTHGDPHCDPAGTNTDGNGGTYSTGAIPGYDVPAGQWFAAEFQMLVKNAYPALP
jgi:cellulose 1,4-beta-cellobiosidase